MLRKTLGYIAGMFFSTIAAAQSLPTWYNRSENNRDVATKQVGEINSKTQGVVTIYGADWCGPCNALEKQIEETKLDERLAKEGIVFRYVRVQYQNGNKTENRINGHIENDKKFLKETLKGVPSIFIDDLGRSYDGDKTELSAQRIRKFKGLEEYIRRYALDEQVHLLTEQEALKVIDAIGSDLFNAEYTILYDNGLTGFRLIPKNKKSQETQEITQRLHLVENGVFLFDSEIVKEYNPKPIDKPMHIPTREQMNQIKVAPGCEKYFQAELKYLQEKIDKIGQK